MPAEALSVPRALRSPARSYPTATLVPRLRGRTWTAAATWCTSPSAAGASSGPLRVAKRPSTGWLVSSAGDPPCRRPRAGGTSSRPPAAAMLPDLRRGPCRRWLARTRTAAAAGPGSFRSRRPGSAPWSRRSRVSCASPLGPGTKRRKRQAGLAAAQVRRGRGSRRRQKGPRAHSRPHPCQPPPPLESGSRRRQWPRATRLSGVAVSGARRRQSWMRSGGPVGGRE